MEDPLVNGLLQCNDSSASGPMKENTAEYRYSDPGPTWSNQYLWPPVLDILASSVQGGGRIIDVGCGSGATAGKLASMGFAVTGVDTSESGIRIAEEAYPDVSFQRRSGYDNLAQELGRFDAVVCLEVIEHCYSPKQLADTLFSLLRPGALAVISTPFHGYWKNLAIALSGRFDAHWSPLWEGGHIKFFSESTLGLLLQQSGFIDIGFRRAGRLPPLAKSMIALARRPGQ